MADSEDIASVLHEAAETHHTVWRITDGDDPDWASWYADWLLDLSELPGLLGAKPVRSHLVHALVQRTLASTRPFVPIGTRSTPTARSAPDPTPLDPPRRPRTSASHHTVEYSPHDQHVIGEIPLCGFAAHPCRR